METIYETVDRIMAKVEALNMIETLYDGRKREAAARWLYSVDAQDCHIAMRILRHAWQHLSTGSPVFIPMAITRNSKRGIDYGDR